MLLEILDQLHEAGVTMITATHDLAILPHLADRALVLDDHHRLVADSPVMTVLEDTDLLLDVNLIHAHSHRHGELIHRHVACSRRGSRTCPPPQHVRTITCTRSVQC